MKNNEWVYQNNIVCLFDYSQQDKYQNIYIVINNQPKLMETKTYCPHCKTYHSNFVQHLKNCHKYQLLMEEIKNKSQIINNNSNNIIVNIYDHSLNCFFKTLISFVSFLQRYFEKLTSFVISFTFG